MKILSICPAVPALNAKGYQVQAFYRIHHLSRNHDVTVLCFGHGELCKERKSLLEDIGVSVIMISWRKDIAMLQVLKCFFDQKTPFQCAIFCSNGFRSTLNNIIRSFEPDLIHLTTFRLLPHLTYCQIPLAIDLVDSMALNFRRRVDQAPWWSRFLLKVELARVTAYERFAVSKSSVSFVVSSVDKREIGIPHVHVLPLGIDRDVFRTGVIADRPIVVLTGNMSYKPNIDAAVWFVSRCWPSISIACPDALFLIVGNSPPAVIRKLSRNPTIKVLGFVPVMADIVRSAQVAVAPMQSGSGMQFKILEAMACAVPLVTTQLGLGDIRAKPNHEIIIANTPVEFVGETIKLLRSSRLRSYVGRSGQQFVDRHHTWDVVNSNFEIIINRLFQDTSSVAAIGKTYGHLDF